MREDEVTATPPVPLRSRDADESEVEVWRDDGTDCREREMMAGERCSSNAASSTLVVSDGTEQLVFVSGPGVNDEQHG
ncbi:hypothetical protein NHX12_026730 [Muraenolepis orangiensis]|uniref:Uncharacterized protein n=1 Tax=Muraenolepis orangiensis TaxID=630683 RepID=A0A9Q0EMX3_9TELE|nr:hypothetical protein NHX12_026730 [Muraenolepis orangiensis]